MLAAERLKQPYMHYSIVERMTHLPEGARLHLFYSERHGPTLTGNPDGLRYLSDLCARLADTDVPHEHVHLYEGKLLLFGNSYRLTLYHEPHAASAPAPRDRSHRHKGAMPYWRHAAASPAYAFSLQDDAGDPLDLALHLDDPEIRYFTASDLKQIEA